MKICKMSRKGRFLLIQILLSTSFFISLDGSIIFAGDTGTSSASSEKTLKSDESLSYKDSNEEASSLETTIKEEFSTEAIWLGFEKKVTIATRHETPVGKAPSIVTVITAEEIKNLGYRTFVEVLRTVPGFEIKKGGNVGTTLPNARGLHFAGQIRLMLDGHLVNNPFRGEAFANFDNFPVENIKRIEIIRGPGSAVYGENAFSAVINIVTFDAKDINGCKVSSGYGSFDTYDENVVFGESY